MHDQLTETFDLALSSSTLDNDRKEQIKEYRNELVEADKGLEENAQLLRAFRQILFTEWKVSQNARFLDDAIFFAREALDEIPKGIHAVTGYADTLVFYAQTKGISFRSSESTEEYITVIQAAIEATSHEHAAHRHFVQRLAWVYWARFEHSKQTEDLNRVMLYINGLLDAKEDIRPETEMVLAGAFHARFLGTKAT
jgi:hypothetical protein